jgi:2,3-bisphosphoglycerate-independent phosphoglycerate mutase
MGLKPRARLSGVMAKPAILAVILDGVGGRAHPEHGGSTPLEAAQTPTLDELAHRGATGLIDPLKPGIVPGSNTGHLGLFDYEPLSPETPSPSRGCIEALGLGVEVAERRAAARANFVTLADDGTIEDRRAGRFSTEQDHEDAERIVSALDDELPADVHARYHPRMAYRFVLVFEDADPDVADTDPGEVGQSIRDAEATEDTDEARRTAKRVQAVVEQAQETLDGHPVNEERRERGAPPVDAIVTRGLGYLERGETLTERFGIEAAGVAGGNAYRGIANYVGMELVDVGGATGDLDTDMEAKVEAALSELELNDLVYLHIKAPDICGENGNFGQKREAIEQIDQALEPLTARDELVVGLTGDHSTPCQRESHSGDPVPLIFDAPGVVDDGVDAYHERACARGSLGRLQGGDFLRSLLDLSDRTKKRE